ncbi:AGAP006551-PA [Anopheles gambiae str. PEST]|uniref:AGAP006551-PA n=5 Tax=gambiae species complex TaxID=44542 RepID=Q7Q599_ANOGA|nr:AGAP006551-PA [Anopheles gambiae str. PEST]
MKSIIALVLFVACAAQAFALPCDCKKYPSNVERHSVPLHSVCGSYSPYEVGSNCLVKHFHPTEVVKSCGNCGNCPTCRQEYYPHYPRKSCGNCGTCSSCRQPFYPYGHPLYAAHPYF